MKKRITSLILIAIMLLTSLPLQIFANPQNPIPNDGLNIQGFATAAPNHHIGFNWRRPPLFAGPTNDHREGFNGHPEGYEIFTRNATVNGSFNYTMPWQTIPVAVENVNVQNLSADFPFNVPAGSQGSIHSFQIIPFHYHYQIIGTNAAGGPMWGWVRAPFAPASPPATHPQTLFMTDINVDVENIGGNMVVIWDNPTFDGEQVFPRFQLQYGVYGQTTTFPARIIDSSMWQVLPGNRLSFTIPATNLVPGTRYSVSVLPLGQVGTTFPNNVSVTLFGGTQHLVPIARTPGRIYYNNDFYLHPYLSVRAEGANYLLANWAPLIPNPPLTVSRVELWSATDPIDLATVPPIGTSRVLLTLPDTQTTHTVRTPIPTMETWFVVIYHMSDGSTMRTNVVHFHPSLVGFTPYSPRILYGSYEGTPPNISLDLTWEAFTRPPYTAAEQGQTTPLPGFGNVYIDRNLNYTVWITDELELLTPESLLTLPPVTILEPTDLPNPRRETLRTAPLVQNYVFDHTFTQYVNRTGTINPLTDNRVFYIAIQATRTEGTELERSQIAFYAIFIPPSADLTVIPPMVPVRTYDVGETTITIEWNQAWWEVHNPSNNGWYNIIGNNNGTPVFGEPALVHPHVILWGEDFVVAPSPLIAEARIRDALTTIGLNPALMPIRFRDFRNDPTRSYEINVVTQAAMAEYGTYEEYVRSIINNPSVWQNINQGTEVPNTPTRRHQITGLLQNTAYFIFFRPVNQHGTAHYPTFTTGTTIAVTPPLVPDLTVPILEVIPAETTDHSISLRFNGSFALEYELFHSTLLADFPEGGGSVAVTNEFIRENGREQDGFIYITIPNLFPGTWYHFWMRARYGTQTSIWSNPVSERTRDLAPPQAPTSIIRASATSLAAINTEHGLELSHAAANRLILELGRIFSDQQTNNAPITTDYTSNNEYTTWHPRTSHRVTYVVNFDNLVPNRRYYTRARTVLTVSRQGDEVIRDYSYIWQLANNPEFLDAIEIIVPSLVGEPTPGEILRIQSDWSITFPFFTGQDDSEFDSDTNPDLFPLPDQDFYFIGPNPGNDFTLTYRIRGNQIGADGNRDNQVNERFISRLVTNRTFNFEIDMSSWQGPNPIHNRTVQIPFGVIEAFDERQINLTIDAGNLTLTIPYRSIINDEVRRMPGLNRFSTVELTLATGNIPQIEQVPSLISTPHTLTASVIEGNNTVNITQFARELRLEMNLPNSHAQNNAVAGYLNHRNTGGWARQNSETNRDTVSFRTRHAGSYAVISRLPAAVTAGAATAAHMAVVTSILSITDLTNYNELAPVHPNQFNQIVSAAASRSQTVAMNQPLSQATFTSLGRSGMLVSGNSVSRADGIASLVRLLEVRTGSEVAFFPTLAESSFSDMGAVPSNLQRNLLKAESLGFIRGNTVNPEANFTFGDLMYILYIVLQAS
ncbi:MAG: hypothetical protein FWF50_07720 [Defluviitaleaceae bacterium]|nr:hypothetical protein [Defluviitaleaceae bacterium]